jgi:ribonuclease Z
MPSSQYVKIHNHYYLLDCGEGTQFQMLKYGVSAHKLDAIFITHLHGDHFFGLIALLSTLSMLDRRNKLKIFSPSGLKEMINVQIDHNKAPIRFDIEYVELDCETPLVLVDGLNYRVSTVPLQHGVPCCGYLFEEKIKHKKLNKAKLPAKISIEHLVQLRNGNDVFDEAGYLLYKNEDYTLPSKPAQSYAYLTDTRYAEVTAQYIKNVSVLYHETTFLKDMGERAATTYHSTTIQAATTALNANVGKLLIGHFSSRYDELTPFIEECRSIFEDTDIVFDGKKIVLG